MNLLIVVHHRFELWQAPAWFGERLAREFPAVHVIQRGGYDGVERDLQDAEVLFTISLRPEQYAHARKLRWLHAPTAAVHQLLLPELVNSNIVITNSREVHGPVVAEHVMALIFALAKKIPQATLMQQKRTWGKEAIWTEAPRPRELAGEILGLIGVGSIGGRVARMASAIGMRVIAVREHIEKGRPDGVDEVFAPTAIDLLLEQSDFVVMAAPLLAATEKLINAEAIRKMKKEAFLINVGRGLQVDEAALAQALHDRRIAGAALDVFEKEPLPAESPLWSAENLLITPHTAGITEKLWHRHYELFSENLRRYLSDQPLQYVIDKQKGY
jgi:phosphoglycerate dehydrogenase-like enzyme